MMRRSDWTVRVAGLVVAGGLLFAGCSDGEEGGKGSGGAGGSTDAGNDGAGGDSGQCPVAQFVAPTNGQKLTEADDADKDQCANGFQHDVQLSTSAPDGTEVKLFANSSQVASSTVQGGTAVFSKVQLDSKGTTVLKAQIGADAACGASATVEVACAGVPTCTISKPAIFATHPALNGVPAAQGGDRVSADGSPYQAAFEVTTNVDDGQPVTLNVDGSPTGVTVNATGGKAHFGGVTLVPDGDHTVVATCISKSGTSGKSATSTFPVDTAGPILTVVSPSDGQHLTGAQFEVCGSTTSADAIATGSSNFCVAIGSASPVCLPAVAGGADAGSGGGACVSVPCPGGAPFDLNITLTDKAGNPSSKKVQQVSCASTNPSVQIVSPVDGTGADTSKHILAAGSPAGQMQDNDGTKPGAQHDVKACTSAATGTAQLFVGQKGSTLSKLGTPVSLAAATATDNCPTGLGFVASFLGATLPESVEDSAGALSTATELRVEVIDQSLAVGVSPVVDVWVDSVKPLITPWTPTPLCGQLQQSGVAYTTNFVLGATVAPVNVTITNGASTQNLTAAFVAAGQATFGQVTFQVGDNSISATATEPSGNQGALQSPCIFKVGNPPTVTWLTPTASTNLNAASDGSGSTPGWQGTLQVQTSLAGVGGATVQFSTNPGGNLGAPVPVDASGKATLAAATIPEGDPVQIIAQTNDTGSGVGTATLSQPVDTEVPSPITALVATIKDRRQTSFHLAWTAPADGGTKSVYSYDLRVSNQPITAGNFDSITDKVTYSGSPAAPGAADGIDILNRFIERDYYFAVAALDKAGNRSPIVSTSTATRANFTQTILSTGITNQNFGLQVDGSSDLNGDGLSDILVATGNDTRAYIYSGKSSFAAGSPDVTFTGTSPLFGYSASVVGDVNSDGYLDVGIGSPSVGKVFVYAGSAGGWNASYAETDATWVFSSDASLAGSLFGNNVTRLGDFNGDGFDDFAIGAGKATGDSGATIVVLGGSSLASLTASVSTPPAGTIAIKGDSGYPGGRLGTSILGLGKFFSAPGNSMVAAAPFGTNNGRSYAFHGQSGTSGFIAIGAADQTVDGPSAGSRSGMSVGLLGNLGGAGLPGVAIGTPNWDSTGGFATLYLGASGQPFGGSSIKLTNSKATTAGDGFGLAIVTGGFSGTSVTTSFIGGDSVPDVGVAGLTEAGATGTLYLFTGQHAASLGAVADVVTTADVQLPLPTGWVGTTRKCSAIKDLNGDGYGDLALGEFKRTTGYNGRVLVLW